MAIFNFCYLNNPRPRSATRTVGSVMTALGLAGLAVSLSHCSPLSPSVSKATYGSRTGSEDGLPGNAGSVGGTNLAPGQIYVMTYSLHLQNADTSGAATLPSALLHRPFGPMLQRIRLTDAQTADIKAGKSVQLRLTGSTLPKSITAWVGVHGEDDQSLAEASESLETNLTADARDPMLWTLQIPALGASGGPSAVVDRLRTEIDAITLQVIYARPDSAPNVQPSPPAP